MCWDFRPRHLIHLGLRHRVQRVLSCLLAKRPLCEFKGKRSNEPPALTIVGGGGISNKHWGGFSTALPEVCTGDHPPLGRQCEARKCETPPKPRNEVWPMMDLSVAEHKQACRHQKVHSCDSFFWVNIQGPVKNLQHDGMSHRGVGGGLVRVRGVAPPPPPPHRVGGECHPSLPQEHSTGQDRARRRRPNQYPRPRVRVGLSPACVSAPIVCSVLGLRRLTADRETQRAVAQADRELDPQSGGAAVAKGVTRVALQWTPGVPWAHNGPMRGLHGATLWRAMQTCSTTRRTKTRD